MSTSATPVHWSQTAAQTALAVFGETNALYINRPSPAEALQCVSLPLDGDKLAAVCGEGATLAYVATARPDVSGRVPTTSGTRLTMVQAATEGPTGEWCGAGNVLPVCRLDR